MRGKGAERNNSPLLPRITPAHAGKRPLPPPVGRFSKDHPRTCGEKKAISFSKITVLGSPPHMRGKGRLVLYAILPRGITPAHAGKSPCWWPRCIRPWDHPRTCGEKLWTQYYKRLLLGSPPHMRGKDLLDVVGEAVVGITPAHAGKRYRTRSLPCRSRDHPRTCGEKSFALAAGWLR